MDKIVITQQELWAFNVLNNHVSNAEQELQRALAARGSFISLLETKYDAKFDAGSGELRPREKEKAK